MIDDKDDAKDVFKEWMKQVLPILVFGGMVTVNVLSFKFLRFAAILIAGPLMIIFVLVFMDDYVDAFFEYIMSYSENDSTEDDGDENETDGTYYSFQD